jgi:hypothetical protein
LDGFLDGLLVSSPTVIVLNVESSHILEADLHTLLLSGRQELVLETIDAGIEAFRAQIGGQLLIFHRLLFN